MDYMLLVHQIVSPSYFTNFFHEFWIGFADLFILIYCKFEYQHLFLSKKFLESEFKICEIIWWAYQWSKSHIIFKKTLMSLWIFISYWCHDILFYYLASSSLQSFNNFEFQNHYKKQKTKIGCSFRPVYFFPYLTLNTLSLWLIGLIQRMPKKKIRIQ